MVTAGRARCERLDVRSGRQVEQTADFYGNAEYVVDAGTYVVTYGPTHVTERGKYLNVWTQVNGAWKIKANMWNTDAPEPTSK